jgi:predicted RNA-binding protein YlqC (UPF0109 family)
VANVSIDQQFVEFVIKSIVGNPDAVSVTRTVDEKGVLLELTVDPEDLGRVIGKRGATAQSVRTLLRALGTKNEARYNLKIVDNGPERPDREPRAEDANEEEALPKKVTKKEEVLDVEDTVSADVESGSLAKSRADLADFDDLDI